MGTAGLSLLLIMSCVGYKCRERRKNGTRQAGEGTDEENVPRDAANTDDPPPNYEELMNNNANTIALVNTRVGRSAGAEAEGGPENLPRYSPAIQLARNQLAILEAGYDTQNPPQHPPPPYCREWNPEPVNETRSQGIQPRA